MRNGFEVLACVSAALGLLGCGGAAPHALVDVRELPAASGRPAVKRVTDLGDLAAIPRRGVEVPTTGSDGVFVIGELVLIEGEDFGKLPTVHIGGRPTAVVARTGNGAIIARVPPRAPSGDTTVEVSHRSGRHAVPLSLHRHGLVLQPDQGRVHVISLGANGDVGVFHALSVPGAVELAFSPDGQAAYVLQRGQGDGRPSQLAVIAMAAAGGPAVVQQIRIGLASPLRLAVASNAPVLAVVDGNHAMLFDLREPRAPAAGLPFALALEPGRVAPRSIALDPAGHTLSLLVAEGNRLVGYDISDRAAPRAVAGVNVGAGSRHPALRDFTYSPSGKQLWIGVGDTALSIAAGHQATRLVAVDVAHGLPSVFAVKPAAEIAGAGAPVAVATSRRPGVGAGTSIRSANKTAMVVMATVHPSLLALGTRAIAAVPAEALSGVGNPGAVLRTDLDGDNQVLFETPGVVTGLGVSYDSKQVVAATTRMVAAGSKLDWEFGVTVVPLTGGESRFLRLGVMGPSAGLLAPSSVVLAP